MVIASYSGSLLPGGAEGATDDELQAAKIIMAQPIIIEYMENLMLFIIVSND